MSCPYKWHSRRSLLIFLHSSISKNDCHVLTKFQFVNDEYNECTLFVGTPSRDVLVIYTFLFLITFQVNL